MKRITLDLPDGTSAVGLFVVRWGETGEITTSNHLMSGNTCKHFILDDDGTAHYFNADGKDVCTIPPSHRVREE